MGLKGPNLGRRSSDGAVSAGALGTLFVCLLVIILPPLPSAGQTWARTYGDDEKQEAWALEASSDGEFYLAGYTHVPGSVYRDAWVVRLDEAGDARWQRRFGGRVSEGATCIAVTSDGGAVVIGHTDTWGSGDLDVWAFKVDRDGNVLWQRTYGGADLDYAYAAAAVLGGGVVFVGRTESFGAAGGDVWVVRIDRDGDILWQRRFALGGEDAYAIASTEARGFLIAAATSFSGGELWEWAILHLDAGGDLLWQRVLGGPGWDIPLAARQTADGGFLVGGYEWALSGGGPARLVKLSDSGAVEWLRTYSGTRNIRDVRVTADGGSIVAGDTHSDGAGGTDFWVAKLDAAGGIEWQRSFGGAADEWAYSILEVPPPAGGYIVAGVSESFGQGRHDAWVLRMDANGNIAGNCSFVGSAAAVAADGISAILPVSLEAFATPGSSINTSGTAVGTQAVISEQCTDPPCGPDSYEEDDACGQTVGIMTAGETQPRNFCRDTEDWVPFEACRGRDYIIETSSLGPMTDTILELYGPDCATLLDANDDIPAPDQRPSRIEWAAPETAVLHIRILQKNGFWGQDRGYDLTLHGDPGPCLDPPLEVSPPGAVQPLVFLDPVTLGWDLAAESGSDLFNLYRGDLSLLAQGDYGTCLQSGIPTNQASDPEMPPPATGWFYLVTGTNVVGEGPMGETWAGDPRPNGSPCP